jgi:hypothetical protein
MQLFEVSAKDDSGTQEFQFPLMITQNTLTGVIRYR